MIRACVQLLLADLNLLRLCISVLLECYGELRDCK